MDRTGEENHHPIHPALRARILQIADGRRQMIRGFASKAAVEVASVNAMLNGFTASQIAPMYPPFAHIGGALREIDSLLRRWADGEPPSSTDIEIVAGCLRSIRDAFAQTQRFVRAP